MIKVRQVYFDDKSKSNLQNWTIPYFNPTLTPFFENSIIAKLITDGDHLGNHLYYGLVSHDLKGYDLVRLKKEAQIQNARGKDVLALQGSHNGHGKLIAYGEQYHGKQFGKIFKSILTYLGCKLDIYKNVKYPIYENHWLAKPKVYEAFVKEWLIPAMQLMENPNWEHYDDVWKSANYFKKLHEKAGKELTEYKNDGAIIDYYPFHTFLCERLISFYIEEKKLNTVYLNPIYNITKIRMNKHDIFNEIIKAKAFTSYLEVGICQPELHFDKIECKKKEGCDPEPLWEVSDPERQNLTAMTSDDYFKQIPPAKKFDLIFIDGLHHEEQVEKDVQNALKRVKENGIIVLHDCLPTTEEMQKVPRIQEHWMGDVWRAFAKLRMTRHDLTLFTVDEDCGLGFIIPSGKNELYVDKKLNYTPETQSYMYFNSYKQKLMNVVSWEYAKKLLEI